MKHTNARKKKEKEEIKVLQSKLSILNKKHTTRGATAASTKLERAYQKRLYELQHPEVLREPSIQEARNMYEKSEVCTKAMFSTYKSRANQQWINAIKKATWEEGVDPDFRGTTQTVSEVGGGVRETLQNDFCRKRNLGRRIPARRAERA